MLPDPTNATWQTVEDPSGGIVGAGDVDLAVWIDQSLVNNAVERSVKAWSPTHQLQKLYADSGAPFWSVDVSGDYLVGVRRVDDYLDEKISFWASPRAYDASQVVARTSPIVPIQNNTALYPKVSTWGDFAAIQLQQVAPHDDGSFDVLERYLLVVRLSDWAMWKIVGPSDALMSTYAVAVGPSHVVVTESYDPNYPYLGHWVKRYRLDELDSFAERIQ